MKILLVASDKGELKGFDDSYLKAVTGVGPIMAAAVTSKMIYETDPDLVISVGSAGSVKGLEVGKAYSFSKIVSKDQDLRHFRVSLGKTLDGNRSTVGELESADGKTNLVLATSAAFSSSLSDELVQLNADAADMEAYGVALSSVLYNKPFMAIKLITDIIGDNKGIGEIQFRVRDGRANLIKEVAQKVEEYSSLKS